MSTQQQKSVDLIEFNSTINNNNNSNAMDVLDKPNTGVVQQMVMSETASASLIATAVAKLTTSSVVTTATAPSTVSVINKSESDSTATTIGSPSSNRKSSANAAERPMFTTQRAAEITITTTPPPAAAVAAAAAAAAEIATNPLNSTQVCLQLGPFAFSLHSVNHSFIHSSSSLSRSRLKRKRKSGTHRRKCEHYSLQSTIHSFSRHIIVSFRAYLPARSLSFSHTLLLFIPLFRTHVHIILRPYRYLQKKEFSVSLSFCWRKKTTTIFCVLFGFWHGHKIGGEAGRK